MQYRVVSVKGENDRELTFVYAAEREDALRLVPGLFASTPVLLGEVHGMSLYSCVVLRPLTSHSQARNSLAQCTVRYSPRYTSHQPRCTHYPSLPPRM